MSAFLNHQLTNVGWDALSTALGGGRLTFFKLQAGSGTIANDAVIPGMTALVAPVYDIAITSYAIEGDGQITLTGNITSELVDAGFTFKELGVFATIEPPVMGLGGTPAGTGIQVISGTPEARTNPIIPNPSVGTPLMYSYCNSYAASDYIPGKAESTNVVNTVQVTIKIDTAPNVVINIEPGEFGFAVTNIGAPSVGPGVWSYTAANVAYLKRLVEGGGVALTEDANTITIATTQSLLTNDLDLYVANGNPDIPPHFSTIQNAISYLGTFLIPTTIKARVHVSRGYYSMPAVVGTDVGFEYHTLLTHPQGSNITIQGPQNNTVTATSISSITGSSNNWSVTVAGISDTSQFEVNDYLIIDSTNKATSNNHGVIWGFFKVTAKTSGSVTFKVPYAGSSLSIAGVNNIKLTPIGVILTPGVNVGGMQIGSGGIGLLQYIGVVGQNSTKRNWGFSFRGNTEGKFLGVTGYNSLYNSASGDDNIEGGMIASFGAYAFLTSCAATQCQRGICTATNGSLIATKCVGTHCRDHGFDLQQGVTHFWCGYSLGGFNGEAGLQCCYASLVAVTYGSTNGSLYLQGNGEQGIAVFLDSSFILEEGLVIRCDNNAEEDLHVTYLSSFWGSNGITGDRSFNISVGSLSSTGGLII